MRLKELRKKNKLTQQEVAEKLFITQHGYSNYEIQKVEPNINILCKLADLYNVTIDYLIGRDFVWDIGYLDDKQKNIVKKLQQLDDGELNIVAAYLDGIISNKTKK